MLKLAVDTYSDGEHTQQTLRELRNMARMGRFAQHVLDTIARQGYYKGKVKGITKRPQHSWNPHNLTEYSLAEVHPIVREEAPPLSDLRVHFGDIEMGSHGGANFKTVPLFISGTIFHRRPKNHDSGKPERYGFRVVEKRKIGMLRLKSSGYSFDPVHAYGNNSGIIQIMATDTPNAQDSLREFGKAVGALVFKWEGAEDQFSHEMRIAIMNWMYEEKHAFRLCSEIRRDVRVLTLMKD